MPNEFAEQTETAEELVEESTESAEAEFEATQEEVTKEVTEETVDYTDAEEAPATEEAEVDFEATDDDKDDSAEEEANFELKDKDESSEEPASSYSVEEYEALANEVESLRAEVEALREFKLTVENEQKDALMDSFPYNTLSAEDKADVIEHKSEYSLEEIKSKLAVIYIEKGVEFAAQEAEETNSTDEDSDADVTTFSLDGEVEGPISDLQKALRKTKED